MWISRKKFKDLEKRIADLEKKVQSQPTEILCALLEHNYSKLTASNHHSRKVQKQPSNDTCVNKETFKCAAQHIKAFHAQASDGKMADFGEPCSDCELAKECKFDWFTKIQPLFEQADATIRLCKQARLQK